MKKSNGQKNKKKKKKKRRCILALRKEGCSSYVLGTPGITKEKKSHKEEAI